METRVRIAPSPTGFWHIGNTRTALFNYLVARKLKGKFILRIEDTDRERYIPEAVDNILEALKWLGFDYDEGPIVQSERLDIYKKYAQELLDKDLAYKDEGAIRFKTQKNGETSWHELIGDKQISFKNETQEDFVILKSDGYPTYNFANVIDDHEMQITLVIRGPEFISSTPKHLMLYQAFGWSPPDFAHVPLILGSDKSKLSKRHGAKPVLEFRDDGYLPEAILNFMALLGWSPPSGKEILSVTEMIEEFDIKDVNVSSPVFDIVKLDWMNGEYIRRLDDAKLAEKIEEYLIRIKWTDAIKSEIKEKILKLTPLVKERIKRLSDFVPMTDFIFEAPEYEKAIFEKVTKGDLKQITRQVLVTLQSLPKPWNARDFEMAFRKLAEDLKISVSEMFQFIRVAISGQTVTPPLFESIEILGEEETLKRINLVVELFA